MFTVAVAAATTVIDTTSVSIQPVTPAVYVNVKTPGVAPLGLNVPAPALKVPPDGFAPAVHVPLGDSPVNKLAKVIVAEPVALQTEAIGVKVPADTTQVLLIVTTN